MKVLRYMYASTCCFWQVELAYQTLVRQQQRVLQGGLSQSAMPELIKMPPARHAKQPHPHEAWTGADLIELCRLPLPL